MDVFNTIDLNGVAIKVDNPTDYYLDEWLYSDYGFQMFYKPARGIYAHYWEETLKRYKFDYNKTYRRIRDVETRKRSLNVKDFITQNHLIQFVSDDLLYSYFFDFRDGMILMRNGGDDLHYIL